MRPRGIALYSRALLRDDAREWHGVARRISASELAVWIPEAANFDAPVGSRVRVSCSVPGVTGELTLAATFQRARGSVVDYFGEKVLQVELQLHEADAALQAAIARYKPTALLVGVDRSTQAFLREEFADVAFHHTESPTEVLERLGVQEVAAIVCGGALKGGAAARLLSHIARQFPYRRIPTVVLAAGDEVDEFQHLVDEDRVFYLTAKPLANDALIGILRSIEADGRTRSELSARARDIRARIGATTLQRLEERARRVAAQTDLTDAGRLSVDAACELTGATRGYCLVYDRAAEALQACDDDRTMREQSPAAGLCSYAARTGQMLVVPIANEDPRYEREADDPKGTGGEAIAIVPISDGEQHVLAVLVIVKEPDTIGFTVDDASVLRLFSNQVASTFAQLTTQGVFQETANRLANEESLFRPASCQAGPNGRCAPTTPTGELGRPDESISDSLVARLAELWLGQA